MGSWAPTMGPMTHRTLPFSRSLKVLGATTAIAVLMTVAGCSPDHQSESSTSAPAEGSPVSTSQAEDGKEGDEEGPKSEASKNLNMSQLLEGVTYKGQPVAVRTPAEIEDYVQMERDAIANNAVDNLKTDPPECKELSRAAYDKVEPDKKTPESYAMADLGVDQFTILAYRADIAYDPFAADVHDPEKCSEFTQEMPGYSQHVTREDLPFEADADKGLATLQTSEISDGTVSKLYNVTAVKDRNVIHVVVTDDSEESIQAANETLDQILERL